MINSAGQQFYQ